MIAHITRVTGTSPDWRRVEITFPADVKVGSFIDVPGWTLEVVRDSAKRITGAVWTGSLPPHKQR